MPEPVSDELNSSMFLLRDSKPGDFVVKRRQINGDSYVDIVLRPVAGSVLSFDANLRPSIEPLADLAGYQAIVSVPNDATRLLLDGTYLRNGSRVYVVDTLKYWDVVDATELPGSAAFIEILTSASLTAAAASAATATTQAGIATAQAVLADADRVQTNADRVQTGLDAAATAADRVQTGLDRVAAAASQVTASAAAVTATDQADIATAQGTLASDRANAAEVSRVAAAASQSTASAAAVTATAQAGIATTKAGEASDSAGTAAAQALIATAKAAEAINAQSVQYKGGVDGGFVPNTSALAGDYYLITANGTSQSKSWLVGERAVYNGTSGSWTQVTSPQIASAIVNTPAGNIASTTVQAALNELDTEKAPLASPTFTGTVSGITKSMISLGNVDNTSDANKPVSTAQQTALNLKADLASPTFTGDPKAPTPATTDSDTSIATTAMVQAVAAATWTQPTAIAITAAGNSNVAAATAQNRYLTQRINVTAFTGTATVTLQSASAIAGDKRRFIVAMPAGMGNLIELRNLTSGGTLLATVPMDGALARTWLGYSTFDGTNWGTVSFSPMSVDEFVLARTAFRGDYIQSDGATANRAQIYGPFDAVNNPREWIAGAASLTIAHIVTVPTATWSDDSYICGFTSTTTPVSAPINELNALILSVGNSSNSLQIIQRGSVVGNYRLFSFANFRSTYSGQTGFLKAYFVQGSTNPVISWNGVDISSSFSASTGGTPPAWLDATMVPTYCLNGFRWPSGPAPIVTPILGTTSAADDAFYMSTGKWPAWVVAGGSPVNVLSSISRNGDFSAVATDWRSFGTATATLNTSTQALDVVATNGGCRLGSAGNPFNVSLTGRGVVFKVVLSNVTGGTVGCYNASGGAFFQAFASGLTNGTHYLTIAPLNKNSTSEVDIAFGGGGISFTIDDFVPVLAGALSLPAYQPINVVDDVSGIGGNQGRILGGTPVTDKRSTRILGRINAASATNQQILGGALLPVPLNYAHEFVDVETDGSVTLSLGDGTTATRYTASTALTAGRTRIALTTPFAADAAKTGLYVNVTVAGGTYAQFSILGHLLK